MGTPWGGCLFFVCLFDYCVLFYHKPPSCWDGNYNEKQMGGEGTSRASFKMPHCFGPELPPGFNYRYEDKMAVKMNVSPNPLHVGSVHK